MSGKRRLKISSRDLRYLLMFALVSTIVTSGVAYSILTPRPTEQFFAMWVLGSTGLAEHYYPNDNPNLKAGEQVNWTLGVYNHMAGLKYAVVRVKLLNSILAGPDETSGSPSSIVPIFEFTRVLLDNETWSIPFVWRISNITQNGDSVLITGLIVNQIPFNGQLGTALSGFNFRLVFELWFYDEAAKDLVFSWQTAGVRHSVWTQIWFNATTTQQ